MTTDLAVPARSAVRELPRVAWAGVLLIAALAGAALAFSIGRYGLFGDELYFLSAGDRLAVSYADQGPVVPALAHLMDQLAPGSMVVLRIPAVVCTVACVIVVALLARELGGRSGAQLLAAGAYACSPFPLAQGVTLATNTVDTFLWALITLLVVRWVRTRADGLLLAAGLVTAVDLQVKWLIPIFWLCVGVSALLLGPRELPRRPMLWVGALLVVLTAVPSLLWQNARGWPQLKMGSVVAAEQEAAGGRLTFGPTLAILSGALGLVVVAYGFWRLWRARDLRPYRFLGLTALLLLAAFVAVNGRPYYLIGIYPVLIAAGAVEFSRRDLRTWARWLVVPLAAASLVITAYALPLRSPGSLPTVDDLGTAAADLTVYGKFGWPELTDATERAYRSLPPDVAAHTVVVAGSYWQASALDQLGQGLPRVYSPNRGFYYFGTPPDSATTVLVLSQQPPQGFTATRRLAVVNAAHGLPGVTRDIAIWRCDNPSVPLAVLWPKLKQPS